MFAIDTNLLIYAYNTYSEFHKKSSLFLERVLNEYDEEGNPSVCLPLQVLIEFINVLRKYGKKVKLITISMGSISSIFILFQETPEQIEYVFTYSMNLVII